MVAPLIFRKRRVLWQQLRAGLQHAAWGYEELIPFGELSWVYTDPKHIWTFPVPGAKSGSDLTGVEVDDEGITFPRKGEYYLATRRGVFKVLILGKASDPGDLVDITAFVARNHYHSFADHWLMAPRNRSLPIDLTYLHAKLFHSDQPLALQCADICVVLAFELHLMGYRVRRVWAYEEATRQGHIVLEAWSEKLGKWIMLDPDYGVVVTGLDGEYLSAGEIRDRRERPDELVMVDIAGKTNTDKWHGFSPDFLGFYTWDPSHTNGNRTARRDYYMERVVARCFEVVKPFRFTIEDNGTDFPSIDFRPEEA